MKKPLRILITFLIYLITSESYSQELNKLYYGIVSDSISRNHYLEFKNDSIIELYSIQRHLQSQFKMAFVFKKENGKIRIQKNRIEPEELERLNQYGFRHFSTPIELESNGKALLDESNQTVYVIYDDFKDDNYITYIINGKEYRQDNALTNSYGLLERKPKSNRKLKQKLKKIESDLKNYKIEVHKGIDAYLKFGYEKVLGVIELTRK